MMFSRLRQRANFYLRAVSYFRPNWPFVVVWIGLIGVCTLLGLLMPWPMAILADRVLGTSSDTSFIQRIFTAILPQSRLGKIVGLAAIGLALKFVNDLLGTAMQVAINHVNYSGLRRIRCDLFRKLQALSLSYHRETPQGDAIYRLNTDVLGAQTILHLFVNTFVAACTLIAMTVILLQRNVGLTLLTFSIVPMLAALSIAYGRRLKTRTLECKEVEARFTAVVQRAMSCIGATQAFSRENEEFQRFDGTIRENIRAWWRLNRDQFTYNLLTSFCFGLGASAIFGYGGYLASEHRLTVGDLFLYTGYLGMVWGPLCQLTGFTALLQTGAAAVERIFEVLDRDPIIADRAGAISLPVQPRTLELRGVHFAYGAGPIVLNGLNVRIEPGQMVALVGASGGGKSTLLNLIPRFYDPTVGAVTFDDIDIRDVKLKDLRSHVAVVSQDNLMLPTTIAENISYGRPDATFAQIVAAARLAGADDFIQSLPQGYDSPVSEAGSNLSGGQRQRLAIARALLKDAPILILDEPTSALDPTNEQLVIETLNSMKGQRTIILVTHRLSTVTRCDQIFVLEAGQVVEAGTHNELLELNRAYAALAENQVEHMAA